MTAANRNGLLVIDKPAGVTSRAVVDQVLRRLPRGTRLGHAGTLDPLATGVLVLCVGVATRLVEYIQDMDKEYTTDLILGATSDTDDADGALTAVAVQTAPTEAAIRAELVHFIGMIEQVPPAFSAARVAGQRAYKLARRGRDVTLAPRHVRVDDIALHDYDYPRLGLLIRCGKGTYIRSLARDLGQRLGCGAYVQTLRRQRIGPFTEQRAMLPEHVCRDPAAALLSLDEAVVMLPKVEIRQDQLQRLAAGQALRPGEVELPDARENAALALFAEGALVGIGRWHEPTRTLRPDKVLRAFEVGQ